MSSIVAVVCVCVSACVFDCGVRVCVLLCVLFIVVFVNSLFLCFDLFGFACLVISCVCVVLL